MEIPGLNVAGTGTPFWTLLGKWSETLIGHSPVEGLHSSARGLWQAALSTKPQRCYYVNTNNDYCSW